MTLLRREMKRQKVSLKRLSETLEVPHSTVKKWFVADDGAVGKINLICRALGMNLDHLVHQATQNTVETLSFTDKQQQLFSTDIRSFAVYWYLVYEKFAPAQIFQACALTEFDYKKILISLDDVQLVKLLANDIVQVPTNRPMRWNFSGPFMEDIFRKWSELVLATSKDSSKVLIHLLQFFQLSKESCIELEADLMDLEKKYARRTITHLNGKFQNLEKIKFLAAATYGSFL
jgi:hypothetical protein